MRDKHRSWLTHTAFALMVAVISFFICWPLLDRLGTATTLLLFASTNVIFTGMIAAGRGQAAKGREAAALRQEVVKRRQTEQELQRALKAAEAANEAKSNFLANVSHEIRTPLNGILGMTTLALAEEVSPRLRNRLRVVRESANALLLLVNDLLDFSKMEAGKFQIHPEPFDLHQELIGTVQMLTDRAKQKGLDLTCKVAPEVPADVNGDAGRLRQILLNLIGNGVKFTKQGGVAVEVRVLEQTETNVRLSFEVRDTGIGIPAELTGRIFSPFVQGDSSTTREYGGTGLGLSIARNLVEMMGGTMGVESTVGKGSTFRFSVLLGLEAATAISLPKSVLRRLKGLTALVIDEDMAQRLATLETLKRWGLRATGAAAEAEAVAYIQTARQSKQAFDFILLDERVGNEAGAAVARRLRQGNGCTCPIIVLGTAAAGENGGSGVVGASIATCLSKPFTPSDLLEAIAITLQFSAFEIQLGRGVEPPPGIGQPPPKPLSVLLAEDNKFNQVVGVEMLEKVGHQVTVVATGREAVEALDKKRYDVVLMDVQMPEMDGLEATALIRSREKGSGSHVPIIAMTAHAMKGDKEACLGAGMDGYLSKPVNQQHLHREIARVLNAATAQGRQDQAAPPSAPPHAGREPAPAEVAPDRRDRRRQRMLELFRAEGPNMLAEIRAAVADDDAARLARAAHKFCGAVSYLAAPEAEVAGRRLEALGREINLDPAPAALAHLEACLARFDPTLAATCGIETPQAAAPGK
jgi:signal transduction histidine kinase/CheY-like chemotaxis protein/HPt (histidine-containing phosphotransfer) domain-containing protein